MSGEHLYVSERAANRRYLPSGIRDESPSARVAGAPLEAEVLVPLEEQVHDGLGGSFGGSLCDYDEGRCSSTLWLLPQFQKGLSKLVVQWNDPTAGPALTSSVL